ncbi:MAG TPA: nitronate monooxygenase [Vicinamibacterales bacterium]|nr:nitronate monooxygenase [Vicinamibacterales bacterium]
MTVAQRLRGYAYGMQQPVLIQGGMGVAVSGWRLARAVSSRGELGVVSGTALDVVLTRRLQLGDPHGDIRRALDRFPDRAVARDVLARFFVPGGIARTTAFKSLPMFSAAPAPHLHALAVVAGFAEVFLAKEGHAGLVGINFLEKVQLPTPPTLYGALLAGVDYVLVGAGIPRDFPAMIDALQQHQPVALPLHVTGVQAGERFDLCFDPSQVLALAAPPPLRRPRFLAIVSSATLAVSLARHGGVDGFVVEAHHAGGHNAPPRGAMTLTPEGEPAYGPRDVVDISRIRGLGLPFWIAGSCASPEGMEQARAQGAAGIQVGTLFAFCEESGIDSDLRARVFDRVRARTARVVTEPLASPTGFPFKVLQLAQTLSEPEVYAARTRRCDLGYLRETYRRTDGSLGYRCPGEPSEDYVRKGGRLEDTFGRKCLCNGLAATVGFGQRRDDGVEPAILTSGISLPEIEQFLRGEARDYGASEVVEYLTRESCAIDRRRAVAGEAIG